MNVNVLKSLEQVRRRASHYTRWRADGIKVYQVAVPPIPVGVFATPEDAIYAVGLHNIFLVLSNELITLQQRLADHIAMTKEMINGKS